MSILNIGENIIKNLPKVSSINNGANFTLDLDEIVDNTLKKSKWRNKLMESKKTINKEYDYINQIVKRLPCEFEFSLDSL